MLRERARTPAFTEGLGRRVILAGQLAPRWPVSERGLKRQPVNGCRVERLRLSGRSGKETGTAARTPLTFHQAYYRHRRHVENFFQRIKRDRRIATRYAKLADTHFNFILLAGVPRLAGNLMTFPNTP